MIDLRDKMLPICFDDKGTRKVSGTQNNKEKGRMIMLNLYDFIHMFTILGPTLKFFGFKTLNTY